MIGTVGPAAFFTALNKPRDGVRPPPFARFEQSSSLSAPPRTALLLITIIISWGGEKTG